MGYYNFANNVAITIKTGIVFGVFTAAFYGYQSFLLPKATYLSHNYDELLEHTVKRGELGFGGGHGLIGKYTDKDPAIALPVADEAEKDEDRAQLIFNQAAAFNARSAAAIGFPIDGESKPTPTAAKSLEYKFDTMSIESLASLNLNSLRGNLSDKEFQSLSEKVNSARTILGEHF